MDITTFNNILILIMVLLAILMIYVASKGNKRKKLI